MATDRSRKTSALPDEVMRARRVDLGLTWEQVSARAGIKHQTLNDIRFGRRKNVQELTKRGLDHAFQWEPGSMEAVIAGGSPTPLDALRRRSTDNVSDDEDALVQLVTELVRQGRPQSDLRKAVEHKDPDARERILIRVIAEGGTPAAGNF